MERIASNSALREEVIGKGLIRATEFNWAKTAQKHKEGYETIL